MKTMVSFSLQEVLVESKRDTQIAGFHFESFNSSQLHQWPLHCFRCSFLEFSLLLIIIITIVSVSLSVIIKTEMCTVHFLNLEDRLFSSELQT